MNSTAQAKDWLLRLLSRGLLSCLIHLNMLLLAAYPEKQILSYKHLLAIHSRLLKKSYS